MEWYLKEILVSVIPGAIVVLSFIKLNAWVNNKINVYNERKNPNNIDRHETI